MRILAPPLALTAVWLTILALAVAAPPAIAEGALVGHFAVLVGGAALVYPRMRSRAAGVGASVLGAFLVPTLWITKETCAMHRLYTLGEALFYALNPVALGILTAAAVEMAVAELVVRRRRTGHWQLANGAGLALTMIAVAAAGVGYVIVRHGPTIVFWSYVGLHRRLFTTLVE